MIAAADLLPDQTYYLAVTDRVWARRYVGSLCAYMGAQPVYVFLDEHDRAFRAYGPDLLGYYATRQQAQQAVIEGLETRLRQQVAQLDMLMDQTESNNEPLQS